MMCLGVSLFGFIFFLILTQGCFFVASQIVEGGDIVWVPPALALPGAGVESAAEGGVELETLSNH